MFWNKKQPAVAIEEVVAPTGQPMTQYDVDVLKKTAGCSITITMLPSARWAIKLDWNENFLDKENVNEVAHNFAKMLAFSQKETSLSFIRQILSEIKTKGYEQEFVNGLMAMLTEYAKITNKSSPVIHPEQVFKMKDLSDD